MHRGHDHSHDGGGSAAALRAQSPAPIGHNGQAGTLQWQTPHLQESQPPAAVEADLDLVETAFVESFPRAGDPVSFLRLAGIAFCGRDGAGTTLHLLRVEIEDCTDVGVLAPLLGGAGFRYAELCNHMTSRRRRLAFVYFDGQRTRRLSLGDARALEPAA